MKPTVTDQPYVKLKRNCDCPQSSESIPFNKKQNAIENVDISNLKTNDVQNINTATAASNAIESKSSVIESIPNVPADIKLYEDGPELDLTIEQKSDYELVDEILNASIDKIDKNLNSSQQSLPLSQNHKSSEIEIICNQDNSSKEQNQTENVSRNSI